MCGVLHFILFVYAPVLITEGVVFIPICPLCDDFLNQSQAPPLFSFQTHTQFQSCDCIPHGHTRGMCLVEPLERKES